MITSATPALEDSSATRARFYRPELDIVRFCAFLMVFFCHLAPSPQLYRASGVPQELVRWLESARKAGACGVDLFFVLSSFLITELLLREIATRGSLDIRAFYVRRALRIWPLYFAFLGIMFWLVPFVLPTQSIDWTRRLAFLTFTANWAICFGPIRDSAANILWSVSIEEQFYAAWPWVARHGRKVVIRAAICMLIAATLFRVLFLGVIHPWVGSGTIWHNTLTRWDPIACGALLSVLLHGRALRITTLQRIGIFLLAAAMLVVTTRFGSPTLGSFEGKRAMVSYPLAALAGSMIVAASLRSREWRPSRFKGVLVYLGRISFGLYVFHTLGRDILSHYVHVSSPLAQWSLITAGAMAFTLVAATISYHWLETPFLKLKNRFTYVRSH